VAGRWQFDGDKLNTLHHPVPGRLRQWKMVKAPD
jgi:hypothetical protein